MFGKSELPVIIHVKKPKTKGRRIAVGDIHGCLQTFKHLVEKVLKLSPKDQLFALGDYIDRGPSSAGVIDYILDLQGQGYQIYTIKGNHEQMFLDNYEQYCVSTDNPEAMRRACHLYGCEDLLDSNGRAIPKYIHFMQQLPHCIELDRFYLVHAGFASGERIFEDTDAMLWQRNIEIMPEEVFGKSVVHGHTPTDIKMIRKRIEKRYFDVVLDNGCVFRQGSVNEKDSVSLGRLCALDLDKMKLYELESMDM